MRRNPIERFLSKIEKNGDCWLWTDSINPNGYGYFLLDRKVHTAQRAAHILFKGAIPDGLHVDHLCRVKRCVNPDHLEAVSPGENVRRGNASTAVTESNRRRGLARTHCPHGHALSEENTYRERKKNGNIMRRCRACRKAERDRRRHG